MPGAQMIQANTGTRYSLNGTQMANDDTIDALITAAAHVSLCCCPFWLSRLGNTDFDTLPTRYRSALSCAQARMCSVPSGGRRVLIAMSMWWVYVCRLSACERGCGCGCVCVYLSVCLSPCPFVCLSICLYWLTVCQSVITCVPAPVFVEQAGVTTRIIAAAMRGSDSAAIQVAMNEARRLMDKYAGVVVGFDLVGECVRWLPRGGVVVCNRSRTRRDGW